MSQRECAGFNWPPLAVAAGDPLGVGPETRSTVLRDESVLPAGLFPFCAGVPAIGVGHAASAAVHRSLFQPLRSASLWAPSSARTDLSPSFAPVVGHPASTATSFSGLAFVPQRSRVAPFQSRAAAVGQPLKTAAWCRLTPRLNPRSAASTVICRSLVPSRTLLQSGVGHPVQPVSDVRSTDARSRERDRPKGVVQDFQVIVNKVEPRLCSLARNLLSKQDWRAALADEVVPSGPQMPLISHPAALACR